MSEWLMDFDEEDEEKEETPKITQPTIIPEAPKYEYCSYEGCIEKVIPNEQNKIGRKYYCPNHYQEILEEKKRKKIERQAKKKKTSEKNSDLESKLMIFTKEQIKPLKENIEIINSKMVKNGENIENYFVNQTEYLQKIEEKLMKIPKSLTELFTSNLEEEEKKINELKEEITEKVNSISKTLDEKIKSIENSEKANISSVERNIDEDMINLLMNVLEKEINNLKSEMQTNNEQINAKLETIKKEITKGIPIKDKKDLEKYIVFSYIKSYLSSFDAPKYENRDKFISKTKSELKNNVLSLYDLNLVDYKQDISINDFVENYLTEIDNEINNTKDESVNSKLLFTKKIIIVDEKGNKIKRVQNKNRIMLNPFLLKEREDLLDAIDSEKEFSNKYQELLENLDKITENEKLEEKYEGFRTALKNIENKNKLSAFICARIVYFWEHNDTVKNIKNNG